MIERRELLMAGAGLAAAGTLAVPAAAQQGLKATLVEQGYFLSCLCRPEGDLELEPAGGLAVRGRITALERLTETVLRARVETEAPLDYRAGQYITLAREDGLARRSHIRSLYGWAPRRD